MDPLFDQAKSIFPEASDDEIMQGINQIRQQAPNASDDEILKSAVAMKQSKDDGSFMKQMATQGVKEKYGLADRQAIVDQNKEDASGINWQAGLAALGAGLQGRNALEAGMSVANQQEAGRQNKLKEFDTQKAQYIADRNDASSQEKLKRESDPNSLESKQAQDLARAMGMNPELTKGLTATRFNSLSPVLEKKLKMAQDAQAKKDDIGLKREALALKKQELDSGKGRTEGQKALDKDYAKDYNDWSSGGRALLSKNLQNLKDARDALSTDSSLTGGLTGVFGDRLTADRVLKQRQKVQSAVQNSLKATLGAQFTEKEGERILKNAYNEAASPETNIESITSLINQLESQASNNDKKAKFYEQNGSLSGYQDNSLDSNMTRQAKFDKDVLDYAAKHNITPERAQELKTMREGGNAVVNR